MAGDNFYSFFKGRIETDRDKYFDGDWSMIYGALDFIESYRSSQPFRMFLPVGYPHSPYCVEDPWFSAIDRSRLPTRVSLPDLGSKPSMQQGIVAGQHLRGWDESRWTELRATYYGMCSRVDAQYRMLRGTLKSSGIFDDTAPDRHVRQSDTENEID